MYIERAATFWCPLWPVQVIQLTRELCQAEAQGDEASHEQRSQPAAPAAAGGAAEPADAATATPQAPAAASLLPPQVAEQIRQAQQRAALAGQGPAAWAVGAMCRAVYSGDGNW